MDATIIPIVRSSFLSLLRQERFITLIPDVQISPTSLLASNVKQCDHMTRLYFQYLAIYSNKNLPKAYKLRQSEQETLPKTK